MKKTGLQIALSVVTLMMGCSKTEPVYEDNQLKGGRVNNAIYFYSTSTGIESWPLKLTETFDGKILKKGSFSGSIGTYGKINSINSTYSFSEPGTVPNPEYEKLPNYQHCMNNYLLDFYGSTATINIVPAGKPSTTIISGSCTIGFIPGHDALINLWTEEWGLGSVYREEYFAGFFNGTVKILSAIGSLSTLVNKTFSVYRIDTYGINLSTGQVNLVFREIM